MFSDAHRSPALRIGSLGCELCFEMNVYRCYVSHYLLPVRPLQLRHVVDILEQKVQLEFVLREKVERDRCTTETFRLVGINGVRYFEGPI